MRRGSNEVIIISQRIERERKKGGVGNGIITVDISVHSHMNYLYYSEHYCHYQVG